MQLRLCADVVGMRISFLGVSWFFVVLTWVLGPFALILMSQGVTPWILPTLTLAGAGFAVASMRDEPERKTAARIALTLSLLPILLGGFWLLLVWYAFAHGGATILP
jgi:hypothetical protein